jgi:hypothetical protein
MWGFYLVDEGKATGALPGTVKVVFDVSASVKASFTIYTHNGTITGYGTGTLHKAPHAPNHPTLYVSFAGT